MTAPENWSGTPEESPDPRSNGEEVGGRQART